MNRKKMIRAVITASIVIGVSSPTLLGGNDVITASAAQIKNSFNVCAGISNITYDMLSESNEEIDVSSYFSTIILNDTTYVYSEKSTESEVIQVYRTNTTLVGHDCGDGWYVVDIDEVPAYIQSSQVGDDYIGETIYELPYTAENKTYMYGNSITSTSSNQYKLLQRAYIGKHGVYQINGRYLVALGTYFTDIQVGQYFDLILEDNTIIPCLLGDVKSQAHTTADGLVTRHSDCMSEFIVSSYLDDNARYDGDLSSIDGWESRVKTVVVYETVEEY